MYITGLNQRGLCEEAGYNAPVHIPLHEDEIPLKVCAGNGTSYIITKSGNLFSWGNGRYGVLGHGDEISSQVPRQVSYFNRIDIKRISAGGFHVIALADNKRLYSWGKNDKGQCGRGFESPIELTPGVIDFFNPKDDIIDFSCGYEFTLLLLQTGTTTLMILY